MKFVYTYTQKNGKNSRASIELDELLHAKLIKFDEQVPNAEGQPELTEKEVIVLEMKHNHQQALEVPVEQAATKEQRIQGVRNFSHSKWEIGWIPYTVSITKPEEVEQLKKILGL